MRQVFLGAAAVVGLAGATSAQATNVLLIIVDDVGLDKVGSFESAVYSATSPTYLPSTPTLDAMAANGLMFTNVYASPVCSPTRAGILTGTYAYENDVGKTVNSTSPPLALSATTLAEVLTDPTYTPGAYEVGLFGKWHLGTDSAGGTDWTVAGEYDDVVNPGAQGFSTFRGGLEGQPEDYYDWLYFRYPELLGDGSVGTTAEWNTRYNAEQTFEDAEDWISSRTDDWVAILGLNVAHTDTADSESDYEEDDLAHSVRCVDIDGDGTCSNPEIYQAMVQYTDDSIQQFLYNLESAGRGTLEDTLIIVIGDNGSPYEVIEDPFLPAGERTDGGKNTAYESGVQVPMIWERGCDWMDAADGTIDHRYHGRTRACAGTALDLRTPGLTVSARAQTLDLFATINAITGSTYPAPSASLDLSDCLAATSSNATTCGIALLADRRQYTETFRRSWSSTTSWGTTGVAIAGQLGAKDGNYKLVGRLQGSGKALCVGYEFYDLASDPYETNNLRAGGDVMTSAQDAAYADLKSWVRGTLNPDWVPKTTCR